MANNLISIGVSEDLYRQLEGSPTDETRTQTQIRVLDQIKKSLQSFLQWAQTDRRRAIESFLKHQSTTKQPRKTVHIPKDLHRQLMAERTAWKEQRQRVTMFEIVNFAIAQFGAAESVATPDATQG